MSNSKHILLSALMVFMLTLPLTACQNSEDSSDVSTSVATQTPNNVFGTFSVSDINGNTVTESVFSQAELTLVNIWGSYCSPCIEEMPALASLAETYKPQGFQIVGILSDALDSSGTPSEDVLSTAKEIIAQTGASYPQLIPDIDMATGVLQGIQYIPTSVFVNKNGSQVGKPIPGARSEEQWKKEIESRLEDLNP